MDVEHALSNGFHDQEHDMISPNGRWRYRIQGKTIDGNLIMVAIEIDEKVIVVTVIK